MVDRLSRAAVGSPQIAAYPARRVTIPGEVVVVRRSSSVTRPASARRAIVGSLATFAGIALLVCPVALADTVATSFENFNTGTVNGQHGWKSAPPGAIPSCNPTPSGGQYDQAVVTNVGAPAAFGSQSLRMSNLCGNGEFFYQTYSTPVKTAAGEDQPNTEYIAQFSFTTTTTAPQPGLFMSVSPDSYEGSRMAWVGLEDTDKGTQVTVSDTPNVDGDFVDHDVALLPRGVPHTIKFWIKLNPGEDNDLVRIYIDGNDAGQCFTTWENYYRTALEQAPPPNSNTPATLNSLQFRTSVQGPAALAQSGGYLFDNVSVTTADGPGPPGCDVPIDKQADTSTVSSGGTVGYTITVRNRGRAIARNLLACDHIPRRMTFVRADRRLLRLGRRRCLLIPGLAPGQRASFHPVLRVNTDAPQGTVTNIADETPGVGPPTPPLAPSTPPVALPGLPPALTAPRPDVPGKRAKIIAVKRAKSVVRVVAKRVRPRRPPPPRVTG